MATFAIGSTGMTEFDRYCYGTVPNPGTGTPFHPLEHLVTLGEARQMILRAGRP
jgi:hypothetical protein